MKTLDIITALNSYIQTFTPDEKETFDFYANGGTTVSLSTGTGASILATLYNQLQEDYRTEELKKNRGASYVSRCKKVQKLMEGKDNAYLEYLKKSCIDNGKQYICVGGYYGFIFDEKNRLDIPITDEPQKSVTKRMEDVSDIESNKKTKIAFDICSIKEQLADWKSKQKGKKKEDKEPYFVINVGATYYNPQYILNIIDILGAETELYQNSNKMGVATFISPFGKAFLMPCLPRKSIK